MIEKIEKLLVDNDAGVEIKTKGTIKDVVNVAEHFKDYNVTFKNDFFNGELSIKLERVER